MGWPTFHEIHWGVVVGVGGRERSEPRPSIHMWRSCRDVVFHSLFVGRLGPCALGYDLQDVLRSKPFMGLKSLIPRVASDVLDGLEAD
jgi:hypothetical protein